MRKGGSDVTYIIEVIITAAGGQCSQIGCDMTKEINVTPDPTLHISG